MQPKEMAIVLAMSLGLTACSTQPQADTESTAAQNHHYLAEERVQAQVDEAERRAYAEGVRQVMLDMAGKLRAQQRFVYEPSVQTCGVQVPGRIANGSYIPPHETCVIESRGRFTERSPVVLPEIGGVQ